MSTVTVVFCMAHPIRVGREYPRGIENSTVAKYMAKIDGSPCGQSWGTFLRNHMPHIAAMDWFGVPTMGLNLLYVLVIVRLARSELVWINVTAHPTAEWIAQQITEAFPWSEPPRYLIRDRDAIYGAAVTRRLRAMGIRDKNKDTPLRDQFFEFVRGVAPISMTMGSLLTVIATGRSSPCASHTPIGWKCRAAVRFEFQ